MLMVESVSATECLSEIILLMKNLANLWHNCCNSSTARFWAVRAECNNRFVICHRSLQFSEIFFLTRWWVCWPFDMPDGKRYDPSLTLMSYIASRAFDAHVWLQQLRRTSIWWFPLEVVEHVCVTVPWRPMFRQRPLQTDWRTTPPWAPVMKRGMTCAAWLQIQLDRCPWSVDRWLELLQAMNPSSWCEVS